jgi:titin
MSPCNVISANSGPGIRIEGASEVELIAGNVVEGNYIGTNASGTSALANGSNGVRIRFASQSRIGGTAAGSGNVISGNAAAGVHLLDVELTLVEGNYIGTDAAGSSDLGNGAAGVTLNDDSTTNTIGGTTAAARNVISGNRASGSGRGIGFGLGEIATDNNLIQGNYIGTDASGTSAVGNDYGIRHGEGASTNDLIGGAVAGAGNLISGNTWGISFEADMFVQGVSILGNYIGTDAAGSGDLGNQRAGVRFLFPDPLGIFSTVPLGDGTTAGANRIAFNRCGVLVDSGNRRPLRGNEIFANEDLGISLVDDPSLSSCATDRVTLNDPNDADLGPNGLENFPVLTAVYTTTGATVVDGTYHGAPNTTTHLDFYSSLQCDPSGFGEGESYLGSTTIVTDGSGNAAFSYSTSLLPGHWVTATATRNFPPDTSEFSVCRRDHATCGAPPNLILEAGTIADAQTFEACETITVGNSNADPFSIETSGDLTLRAGLSVAMLNGFQVLGSLVVEINPTP